MKLSSSTKPATCPTCGSDSIATIMYGYPSSIDTDAIARGEIILGGCTVHDESPSWKCNACGAFMHLSIERN
jgi:hypothetical protein